MAFPKRGDCEPVCPAGPRVELFDSRGGSGATLVRPSFPRTILTLVLLPSSPRSPWRDPAPPRSLVSGLEAPAVGGRRRHCPEVNIGLVFCLSRCPRLLPSPRSRLRALVSASVSKLVRNRAASVRPVSHPGKRAFFPHNEVGPRPPFPLFLSRPPCTCKGRGTHPSLHAVLSSGVRSFLSKTSLSFWLSISKCNSNIVFI